MQRSRCVDDFSAIRARMEELQREREQAARKNAAGQDHGSAGSPDRWDGTSRRPIANEEQRRVCFPRLRVRLPGADVVILCGKLEGQYRSGNHSRAKTIYW